MKQVISLLFLVPVGACGPEHSINNEETQQDDTPQISVMALMTEEIVPLTNSLWAIDEPQSDEEWNAYLSVADDTIAAFEQTKDGGTGANDDNWAANPRWTDYANQAIDAAEQFKKAITAQDMEMIWDAGDALLGPCTECHQDFNPALQNE